MQPFFTGHGLKFKSFLPPRTRTSRKISNKNVASASNKKVEEIKLRCTVRHQNDKWANTAVPNMWAADPMVAEGFSAGHWSFLKGAIHSQLIWAILTSYLRGKNLENCAVLTGNSAGLRTVLSSRLSHRELRSSLRKPHSKRQPCFYQPWSHAQEGT